MYLCEEQLDFAGKSNDPPCMCASCCARGHSACLYTGVTICAASPSYLQGFPLAVEQLGDVPCHSLHQVLGVVSLDFKLALLLIINLQMENTWNQRSGDQAIGLITNVTEKLFACFQSSAQNA